MYECSSFLQLSRHTFNTTDLVTFNRKSSFDMELLEANTGNRAKESPIGCNAIVLELLDFKVQLTKVSL